MAVTLEIKERHRHHLESLLSIKKKNEGTEISGLQEEIRRAVAVMEQEDVTWVEKITGVIAL
jgi:hypothetical protein